MHVKFSAAAAMIVLALAAVPVPAMSQKKLPPRPIPPAKKEVTPVGALRSPTVTYLPFEKMIMSDELRAAVARKDNKAISAILAQLSVEVAPGDGRAAYTSASQGEDCPAGTVKVTAGEFPGTYRCVPLGSLLVSVAAD